ASTWASTRSPGRSWSRSTATERAPAAWRAATTGRGRASLRLVLRWTPADNRRRSSLRTGDGQGDEDQAAERAGEDRRPEGGRAQGRDAQAHAHHRRGQTRRRGPRRGVRRGGVAGVPAPAARLPRPRRAAPAARGTGT